MTPELWEDVSRLFLEATDLPPAARQAFLAGACAPTVRRHVEELLDAAPEAERYFERPGGVGALFSTASLGTVASAAAEALEDLPPGARLGPWEVLREAGRGGMGTVHLARRADGLYDQRVALKVVKRGMDTDAIVRRFHRERAVLAGLEHPGIARLVDGGAAPDGRPYLAMEFVDGVPITDYCDGRRLGVTARLRVFLQVCEAVAYAHRRLVVHRDLKPSNVLVREVEGEGPRAALLDFGLAALLAADDGAAARLTGEGPRLLTPAYAAPEQLAGGPITTATDVYALGVLLYELLAGRRPYDLEGLSPAEVERAVREQPPARPSTVVRARPARAEGAASPAADRAGSRRSTPARLRRRLRGDLDAVVLRALEKDPERRYPSVEALAADLRRHLNGHAVTARRVGAGYRAWAFVRRHRWGVSAAAGLALLLAAFGAYALGQARAVAAERERAEAAAAFVLDLLAEADPREGAGGATPVRDVLDRAAERAEAQLAGRPDLLARVLLTAGRTLAELGAYDRAEAPLRRALALAERAGQPATAAAARVELAGWARGQGRYDEAEAEARRAVTATGRLGASDADALLRVRALGALGATEADRGRFQHAVGHYRAAVAAARRAFPGGHRATALSLAQLGGVLSDLGALEASAAALREAAAMQRRLLGPSHPELAFSLMSLGNTLELRDSLDAAAEAHGRALAVLRAAYGETHRMTAMALHNLASAEDARGRPAAAARLYRRAIETKRRLYGEVHGSIAASLINLGYLQFESGDAEAAEATTREAHRVALAAYGPEHYRTAMAAYNLGEILLARGAGLPEAEGLLHAALEADRQTYGPEEESALLTQLLLGRIQAARGDCRRAAPTLRSALQALGPRLSGSNDRRAAEGALAACSE